MEKDIKKNNDKLLLVLIVILVVITIILLAVRIFVGKSIDTEDKLIVELHNYFNTENLSDCEGLFTYSDKRVDINNTSGEAMLCLAYQKADLKGAEEQTITAEKKKETCTYEDMVFRTDDNSNTCTITVIDKKVLDESYKKLYDKEIKNADNFRTDNFHICYLSGDKYYCGLSETFSYTIGSESYLYRVMERAVKKGSRIEIYDYFVKITDNICYANYTTATKNEKCTKAYTKEDDINFEFLKTYGTKYKHVFTKNSEGSYSWVSSEPIN